MSIVMPGVSQSHPAPDDEKPLLDVSIDSSGQILVPRTVAVRRRLEALARATWDSGIACVCGAALVFSFAALFVKLMGSSIPVFEIVAFRSFTSFTVCAAYARAAGISPLFGHRAKLHFLISRGLFGAAAMTTYYFSLKMLPLADAVTLFFLNPAITAVAAWAIMKEPLGLRGVLGVLVSLCGLVLITRPPFLFGSSETQNPGSSAAGLHGDGNVGVGTAGAEGGGGAAAAAGWDEQRLLGTMFGLLSAVLSAGAFISIRHIGKSEPALVMSVYFHVSAAATSVVPLAVGFPKPAVAPTGPQWALLLGVAACSFWGQILIGRGFQLLHAARASAINLTQVVYSYLLGLMFLNEQLTLLGGAGSLLIAAGAVLVNFKPKKPPPPLPQPSPTASGHNGDTAAAGQEDSAAGGKGSDAATATAVEDGGSDGGGSSSSSHSGSSRRSVVRRSRGRPSVGISARKGGGSGDLNRAVDVDDDDDEGVPVSGGSGRADEGTIELVGRRVGCDRDGDEDVGEGREGPSRAAGWRRTATRRSPRGAASAGADAGAGAGGGGYGHPEGEEEEEEQEEALVLERRPLLMMPSPAELTTHGSEVLGRWEAAAVAGTGDAAPAGPDQTAGRWAQMVTLPAGGGGEGTRRPDEEKSNEAGSGRRCFGALEPSARGCGVSGEAGEGDRVGRCAPAPASASGPSTAPPGLAAAGTGHHQTSPCADSCSSRQHESDCSEPGPRSGSMVRPGTGGVAMGVLQCPAAGTTSAGLAAAAGRAAAKPPDPQNV